MGQPMENLSLTVDAEGVALLSLHGVEGGSEPNHFSPGLAVDLHSAVAEIGNRADIRGVVLHSARDDGFLLGAKLEGLLTALGGAAPTASSVAALLAPIHALLRAIETGGKPWVAAINGNALGGGYELCLACHRRLLLDDGAIRVGLPERSVGLIPGGGGTQRLPRLIGIPAAMRLMLEANILAPAGALAAGLVDELQPTPESLLHAAHDWVLAQTEPAVQPWDQKGWRLPGGSGAMAAHASETFGLGLARVRGGPVAQRASGLALLEAVYEGAQLPIVRALALEAKVFAALVAPPVEGEHACDR